MGLVPMQWRRQPEGPSNLFGKDEAGPHDERAEEAWVIEAREAVARKLILGCNVTPQELKDARLTVTEARALAVDIERRLEASHKRLTTPPEPKEVGLPVATYVPDPEPEQPAPKRRRKKRATKLLMRQAIDRRHDERELFTD